MNRKRYHLELATLLRLAERYHVVLQKYLSHSRSLEACNLSQYCFIFYTIYTPVCCVGCLTIANICTYISLYIRNTAILVNKKLICISPTSACEHLWPLPGKCTICSTIPVKIPLIGQLSPIFMKFQSNFFENLNQTN